MAGHNSYHPQNKQPAYLDDVARRRDAMTASKATVGFVRTDGTALHGNPNHQPEGVMIVAASERTTFELGWAIDIIRDKVESGGRGKGRARRALLLLEELHTISIAAHHARHPARGED